jgi:hypothetical protein
LGASAGLTRLIGEVADHLIADVLVVVVEHADRDADVARWRGRAQPFARSVHREDRQRFLATVDAQDRLHRDAGAAGHFIEREVIP